VARLIVGPGSWDAEDAAQDALVDISRGISSLSDPVAIRGWAMRITVRRAHKVAKQERRRRLFSLESAWAREVADRRTSHAADVADLKRAFYSLPLGMRTVAVLRLYAGLSERETADAMGTSVGTTKSQLHEARARLQRVLSSANEEGV
jgi:RNA polymerase sigma-70 factor (ECF subfamily)